MQIVTDSANDLPKELIEKHNILVVPLNIEIDGKNYVDGIDISHEEFYEKMKKSKDLPKTSQPSPQSFIDVFKEAKSRSSQVLALHLSSRLSGTYNGAMLAKDIVGEDIEIFDTLSGSMGTGLQILKAIKLFKEGLDIKEIIEQLKVYREQMKVIVYLEDLENAVKGGRVTRTKEVIANLLNLKPIVHVDDGYVKVLKTIRGKKRAIKNLLTIMEESKIDFSDKIIGITHCNTLDEAIKLKDQIIKKFNPLEVIVTTMGPVISTHAGIGGLLVCY